MKIDYDHHVKPIKTGFTVYREDSRGFVFSDPISLEAQLEFVVKSLTDME